MCFWKALNILKAFQKHMIGPPFLTIKNIQLPSNSGNLSNGDQIFWIAI
jgi:hypothetical protein